jgi:hypothetical protein
MFDGLETDSEDDHAAEEEAGEAFDSLTMVKEFLVDKTISRSWLPEFREQLMITIAQFQEFSRALRIFRALHEADLLDASRVVPQLQFVVAECTRPAVCQGCPVAAAGCSAIFARFVELNAAPAKDIGASFPPSTSARSATSSTRLSTPGSSRP